MQSYYTEYVPAFDLEALLAELQSEEFLNQELPEDEENPLG